MTQLETIASLVNCMNAAIRSGDWKVDGACDCECHIDMAEAMLEQAGAEKDHAKKDSYWILGE